jgi:hypothetical protein
MYDRSLSRTCPPVNKLIQKKKKKKKNSPLVFRFFMDSKLGYPVFTTGMYINNVRVMCVEENSYIFDVAVPCLSQLQDSKAMNDPFSQGSTVTISDMVKDNTNNRL